MRKDLKKLLLRFQPQIIGILEAHGYATSTNGKFSGLKLTNTGKGLLDVDDLIITEEWIKEWRFMWPVGKRGNQNVVRDKLSTFIMEKDCSLNEIIDATNLWFQKNDPMYVGNANNFFYKQEKDITVSRCEEYLEMLKEESSSSDDIEIGLSDEDY